MAALHPDQDTIRRLGVPSPAIGRYHIITVMSTTKYMMNDIIISSQFD
jgi:hypothetical protein